jgi:hypothetical protein
MLRFLAFATLFLVAACLVVGVSIALAADIAAPTSGGVALDFTDRAPN